MKGVFEKTMNLFKGKTKGKLMKAAGIFLAVASLRMQPDMVVNIQMVRRGFIKILPDGMDQIVHIATTFILIIKTAHV